MKENNFFVHESSYVDNDVEIGHNTKIWHFSHIQTGAKIGSNCSLGQNVNISNNVIIGNNVKIQNNVSIYEGVEIEENVFCGPSIVFTNITNPRSEFPQNKSSHYKKTIIRKSASIGANATILCGIEIGQYALIGAGAVVTKNIPEYALVVGNPGKIVGWVDKKGVKLEFEKDSKSKCKKFYLKNGIAKPMEDL